MICVPAVRFAGVVAACVSMIAVPAAAQDASIVIRASTLIDGSGKVLRDATVVVKGRQIARVEERSTEKPDYDLGSVTLLPGLIDTHSHIVTHFGRDGRAVNDGESDAEQALYAMEQPFGVGAQR